MDGYKQMEIKKKLKEPSRFHFIAKEIRTHVTIFVTDMEIEDKIWVPGLVLVSALSRFLDARCFPAKNLGMNIL
jgi:hypothetical protein